MKITPTNLVVAVTTTALMPIILAIYPNNPKLTKDPQTHQDVHLMTKRMEQIILNQLEIQLQYLLSITMSTLSRTMSPPQTINRIYKITNPVMVIVKKIMIIMGMF